MEDDLNFFEKEDDLNFFENKDDLIKLIQPKKIKSKKNGCGTAPGNLVCYFCSKISTLINLMKLNICGEHFH